MLKDAPIRVLLVDDHAIVRSGLKYFFSTTGDIEVIGEAENGARALALCAQLQPDVVLMDLVMAKMDGITATQAIHRHHPDIQVLVLTCFYEEDLVERVLRAGAVGYLLKDVEPRELADAIRAARAGQSTLAPQAMQMLIKSATQPPKPGHDLTEREREALAYLVQGLSNGQIAEQMVITRNTVRHHVRNILSKLNAANRTEAVSLAMQYGLVELSQGFATLVEDGRFEHRSPRLLPEQNRTLTEVYG